MRRRLVHFVFVMHGIDQLVLACRTGVIFFAFSGERRYARVTRGGRGFPARRT